jgi:hypothetical protein
MTDDKGMTDEEFEKWDAEAAKELFTKGRAILEALGSKRFSSGRGESVKEKQHSTP